MYTKQTQALTLALYILMQCSVHCTITHKDLRSQELVFTDIYQLWKLETDRVTKVDCGCSFPCSALRFPSSHIHGDGEWFSYIFASDVFIEVQEYLLFGVSKVPLYCFQL